MKSWCGKQLIAWLFFVICMVGTPLFAADDTGQDTDKNADTLFQVMLGAVRYSNLNLNYQSTKDPSLEATSTFTWMPLLGVSGGIPLIQKPVALGLEGGVLFSWMSDSVRATGADGSINIHIDNQLYLLDLFIGPYVSAEIEKRVHVYGGLGPLLMFGQNNNQNNEYLQLPDQTTYDSYTSSAFGPGLYARTGIEFRLKNNSWMGVGVRGFMSRLNFNNVSGTTDINGLQLMITYSIGVKSPDDDAFWDKQ
jgi:hypothetical protein